VHGDADEELVRQRLAARQPGLLLRRIDGGDDLLWALLDASFGEPVAKHL
jgi:hypothetical protein